MGKKNKNLQAGPSPQVATSNQQPTIYPNPPAYPQAAYPPQGYPQQGYLPYWGGQVNQGFQQGPSYSAGGAVIINTSAAVPVPPPPPKNYTVQAIVAIFLFWPTGIVALLKANQAQELYRNGNYAEASACNLRARLFIRITAGMFAITLVAIILANVLPVVLIWSYRTSYYYVD